MSCGVLIQIHLWTAPDSQWTCCALYGTLHCVASKIAARCMPSKIPVDNFSEVGAATDLLGNSVLGQCSHSSEGWNTGSMSVLSNYRYILSNFLTKNRFQGKISKGFQENSIRGGAVTPSHLTVPGFPASLSGAWLQFPPNADSRRKKWSLKSLGFCHPQQWVLGFGGI